MYSGHSKNNCFSAERDEYGADTMTEIHIIGRITLNLWRVMKTEAGVPAWHPHSDHLHSFVFLHCFRIHFYKYNQFKHQMLKLEHPVNSCIIWEVLVNFCKYREAGGPEELFSGCFLLFLQVTLNNYSFENVAFHVLHQRFPLYSSRTLSDWFDHSTHLYRSMPKITMPKLICTRSNPLLLLQQACCGL